MDSSAPAGRVASAVLDPRRWQGLARRLWHGACRSLGMKKIINVIVVFLHTLAGNTDEARRIDGQRADVDKRRR
jgi:hypothetical protein